LRGNRQQKKKKKKKKNPSLQGEVGVVNNQKLPAAARRKPFLFYGKIFVTLPVAALPTDHRPKIDTRHRET